ncbi:hypothetical protein DMUE_1672 [Dictyocoela muelleri]|nr:hypothetical protein DMUE_1672 [Dictyocoela muelleri]
MITLFVVRNLCASNFHEDTTKQKNNVENMINSNLYTNQNPHFAHLDHIFAETAIEKNKFDVEMILKRKNPCLINPDSSANLSNLRNNQDQIYATMLNSQTMIHAHDHIINIATTSNHLTSFIQPESWHNMHNFLKAVKQTPSNDNNSSNNHSNFENQNNNNINQALEENKFYQSDSNDKNRNKQYEISKYPQNEEVFQYQPLQVQPWQVQPWQDHPLQNRPWQVHQPLQDQPLQAQPLDYSMKNIHQFDELIKNKDASENQGNSSFNEIDKPLENDQKLNKRENKESSQNIIPQKRAKINPRPIDIDSLLSTPTNDVIIQQTETPNIKTNNPKLIATLKDDNKLITSNIKNPIKTNKNDKITNSERNVSEISQLNFNSTLPETTKQINNFTNTPSTSKTYSSIKNHKTNSPNNSDSPNENNSPYDNDFDSPNFSLDFLNSYIIDLNEKYLEQCDNIFSVVVDKISEVLIHMESENKFYDSEKYKRNLKYGCYMEINNTFRFILKELFGCDLPIYICANKFVNINNINLDIDKTKYNEYNIFRTAKETFGSLISNIEQKYCDEAKKMVKTAYNNFLEKLNPEILGLNEKINSGKIKNKKILYSNIIFLFTQIHKSDTFTNDQIIEPENLIIYKVLKSISKFLKRTSADPFLSQVFPELRIINILYHSRIKDHQLSGRKFHAGIFLKKILKLKLENFKDKYQSVQNIDYLDNTYFKEILEIRSFYIFNLFQFLNIKKPYLLGYILLSIKSYRLQSQKINYIEKKEFEKIFSLHVLNLDKILDKQVFIHVKPFLILKFENKHAIFVINE